MVLSPHSTPYYKIDLRLGHFGKFTKALLLKMYIVLHSLVQHTNTTIVFL